MSFAALPLDLKRDVAQTLPLGVRAQLVLFNAPFRPRCVMPAFMSTKDHGILHSPRHALGIFAGIEAAKFNNMPRVLGIWRAAGIAPNELVRLFPTLAAGGYLNSMLQVWRRTRWQYVVDSGYLSRARIAAMRNNYSACVFALSAGAPDAARFEEQLKVALEKRNYETVRRLFAGCNGCEQPVIHRGHVIIRNVACWGFARESVWIDNLMRQLDTGKSMHTSMANLPPIGHHGLTSVSRNPAIGAAQGGHWHDFLGLAGDRRYESHWAAQSDNVRFAARFLRRRMYSETTKNAAMRLIMFEALNYTSINIAKWLYPKIGCPVHLPLELSAHCYKLLCSWGKQSELMVKMLRRLSPTVMDFRYLLTVGTFSDVELDELETSHIAERPISVASLREARVALLQG